MDAVQGVEAQTVANVHLALKQGLTIIPVINKIDLPNADIPTVKKQLEDILAIPSDEAIEASAKAGLGITEILEAIVDRIPPPHAKDETLRGLVLTPFSMDTVVWLRISGSPPAASAPAWVLS